MKKMLAILLAMAMVLSLAACGGNSESAASAANNDAASAPAADNASAAEPAPAPASNAEAAPATADDGAPADEGGEDAPAASKASDPDFIYFTEFNSLADAGRKSTLNSDERYGTVTVAQFAAPTELQPINHLDMGKGTLINEVYEKLLQKHGSEYVGMLAKSWEEIDDTTYEFVLFDYIKDSEGNEIKASDVVFSYDLEADAGFAANFQLYDHAEAVDDYTVRIVLNAPIDDLVSFDALFTAVDIVSEKAYGEHDFNNDPVATGPYKVESFTTGSNLTLVANDNYWQTDESALLDSQKRNCERISIDIIGDSALRLIALEDGSTMFCDLNSEDLPNFMSGGQFSSQYYLIEKYESMLYDIVPNISPDSPLNDINLRLAVWYAIDSTQYVLTQNELLTKAANVGAIPAYKDYQESWSTWTNYMTEYDMDKATEYLKKSNYNGEELSILLEDMPAKEAIAEVLQLQLEALGVKAKLNEIAHALMNDTIADSTAWDFLLLSGGTRDKVISRYKDFFGAPNGWVANIFGSDQELQDMIADCATQSTYSVEKTEAVMKYVIDNAYDYNCTYSTKVTAYSLDYAGLYFDNGDGDLVPGAYDYYLD